MHRGLKLEQLYWQSTGCRFSRQRCKCGCLQCRSALLYLIAEHPALLQNWSASCQHSQTDWRTSESSADCRLESRQSIHRCHQPNLSSQETCPCFMDRRLAFGPVAVWQTGQLARIGLMDRRCLPLTFHLNTTHLYPVSTGDFPETHCSRRRTYCL